MVENILAQVNGDMSYLKRDEMGFESCKDDSDVLFCSANKNVGTDYYQYVLIYTDNILEIIQNPEDFISDLRYRLQVSVGVSVKREYIWREKSYISSSFMKLDYIMSY